MGWNEQTPQQMAEVVAEYSQDRNSPNLYATMNRLGIKDIQTLQRHCRNYGQYEKIFFGQKGLTLPQQQEEDIVELPIFHSSSRVTDIQAIEPDTDQELWLKKLAVLSQRTNVTVGHLCDIHFPFQDDMALSLALKVMERTQPDVIVVGSDAFDFAMVSAFGTDPDVSTGHDDELDLVRSYWYPFIHRLREACPKSVLVFVFGNHERRILTFMIRQAPQFRKTIWRESNNIIRCDGQVLYLGETDRVRIGPLLVQHGNRHGVNAAKGHLEDMGYQASTMFGHTHHIGFYSIKGEDFSVSSANSGCLCELKPHYVRATGVRKKFQHGTCIADVNMETREVHFDNLEFHPTATGMQTRIDRQTIEV